MPVSLNICQREQLSQYSSSGEREKRVRTGKIKGLGFNSVSWYMKARVHIWLTAGLNIWTGVERQRERGSWDGLDCKNAKLSIALFPLENVLSTAFLQSL